MAALSTRLIITILGIFGILIVCHANTEELEHYNEEVSLKQELFKNYDKHTLPPHSNSSPINVTIGFSLVSISNVDPRRQKIETEGWLKMAWNDKRLQWNDTTSTLTAIRVPIDKVWVPDIELYNNANWEVMNQKSQVLCLVYPNGEVIWIPPVSLDSFCKLDLARYPYDVHECSYKFGSWTHDGFHLNLKLHDDDGIDMTNVLNDGGEWEILDTSGKSSVVVYSCCKEPYPDVTFKVNIRRRSPFYKVAILCPLVADIFLILLSFWICPLSYERIILNVVSFLSLNWIVLHLARQLPAIGNNPPLIMILCDMLIILSVVIMVLNVCFLSIIKSNTNKLTPRWITVLLQSWIAKLLCIQVPKSFEIFTNDELMSTALNDNDTGSKPTNPGTSHQAHNPWVYFFQMMDRTAFVACLIILVSFTIAASV